MSKTDVRAGPAILVAMGIVLQTACAPATSSLPATAPGSEATYPIGESDEYMPTVIVLPDPDLQGTLTLEAALARRRSVREFSDAPLTLAEVGQLLWAAQGITHPEGYRTAPSAGALYPLELYAVTSEGVFHYEPPEHQLVALSRGDARPALYEAALRQEAVLRAPLAIVMAAVYSRTAAKYGQERSPRYVHLEAGHAAQNVLLQAAALDLGAVPVGAFGDAEVAEALGLPADQQPVYLIPVGHAASG